MAYQFTEGLVGLTPIASIDAGYTPPNGSAAIPTGPAVPGTIVRAIDDIYGMGEFILLRGCANTVVGSVVRYNDVDFDTTLAVNTALQNVPVAVAMSANTSTSEWGWYQISGTAVIAKVTGATSQPVPNASLYLSPTAGKVKSVASAGMQINGCKTQTLSTLSTATTVLATIQRPCLQGAIT